MRSAFLALGLLAAPAPHDSFVSILTIHHNAEAKTLEMTWRMTTHDLENVLEPVLQKRLQLGTDKEVTGSDSVLNKYLTAHLQLALGGKPIAWHYIGKEVEMDDLYCYLQADEVPDPTGLSVSNSLLFDLFAEQQNITHLEVGGRTLSHDFLRDQPQWFTFVP